MPSALYLFERVFVMKIYFNLELILRHPIFIVNVFVEENTSSYLRIAEIILQAIILIITLNLDAMLTLIGA